jgi:hypothetical protein
MPIANVGILWSQRNTDFFGRDEAEDRVDAPYTGFMHALVRARIPYVPVHADDLDRARGLKVLILPNVGALSAAQATAVRRFVQAGGSLVATGATSVYDEWGDPRPDFALADLFACHLVGTVPRLEEPAGHARASIHTYLRLSPELRARVDGPHVPDEPPAVGERHAVLEAFDETDILPFGGTLTPLTVDASAVVPLTFVPAFPTYPPETAWMREPRTEIPGLVLSQHGRARVAYMPADLDRRYASEHLPDHAQLLANVVRWAADQELPLSVEGTGLIDCHLYEQPGRMILHLVNLTSEATWRAPLVDLIRVGPFTVRIRTGDRRVPSTARLLVAGTEIPVTRERGAAVIELNGILDHEVIVLGE